MSDQLTLLLVNATFVVLVAASALTWAIVIVKLLQQRKLNRQTDRFEKALEGVAGLPSLDDLKQHDGPAARVAKAGVKAWASDAERSRLDNPELGVRVDLLERSLKQQLQRERKGVETGLPLLASIGSTSPFVGLFGTVLGIIHALTSISASGSASLEVVAGPIGEALVATAVGIGVAVPAVLAYNYFLRRAKTLGAELEDFANSLVTSAVRSSYRLLERDAERSAARSLPLTQEASV